jgi:hypothetical protein
MPPPVLHNPRDPECEMNGVLGVDAVPDEVCVRCALTRPPRKVS